MDRRSRVYDEPHAELPLHAQASKRRDRLTAPHLKAYDRALEWAATGSSGEYLLAESATVALETEKSPA